jgi:hypothetical protein
MSSAFYIITLIQLNRPTLRTRRQKVINDKKVNIWNENVVADFKVLSHHLPGGTENRFGWVRLG